MLFRAVPRPDRQGNRGLEGRYALVIHKAVPKQAAVDQRMGIRMYGAGDAFPPCPPIREMDTDMPCWCRIWVDGILAACNGSNLFRNVTQTRLRELMHRGPVGDTSGPSASNCADGAAFLHAAISEAHDMDTEEQAPPMVVVSRTAQATNMGAGMRT